MRCGSSAADAGRNAVASGTGGTKPLHSWGCGLGGFAVTSTTIRIGGVSEKSKLVGVRHVVQSEPDERFLLRPEFLRGIAMLEEFGLAYDILIYQRHLPVAAEFVARFPRQRFVLDHLAKLPIKIGAIDVWARGIRELASFPNVYCKVSGLVTEADWP